MSALEQAIPEGYKQTEVGVIPENWIVEPLEYFTSFISYGFTNPMPTVYDGPTMITARDINKGRIQYSTARCTSENAFKKLLTPKSKPKTNDLLLTKDGTLGRLALVDKEDICINQSVALLRPNSKINPSFFKLLLESPYYQEKMLDDAGGSTIKHIYITIVNKMLLGLPPELPEQTAIANALSDVDALLTELEKLIAKKQAIKTATMQQLLTGKTRLQQFATYTEGKKQGQTKGTKPSELGEIPEDWDCLDFSDIFTCKQGIQVPVEKQYFVESTNTVRFIRIIDLTEPQEPPRYISNPGNKYLVKKSDLFMVRYGVPGLVGFNYEGVIANNLFRLLPKVNCSTSFYAHYLSYRHKDILDSSGSSTMPAISFSTLAKFKIVRPHSENEQTAIANILSDMDNEIQTLEQRLAKTRQIKQGMMQELLTGRTRLSY